MVAMVTGGQRFFFRHFQVIFFRKFHTQERKSVQGSSHLSRRQGTVSSFRRVYCEFVAVRQQADASAFLSHYALIEIIFKMVAIAYNKQTNNNKSNTIHRIGLSKGEVRSP